MLDRVARGGLKYLTLDDHMNVDGHRLIAERLTAIIQALEMQTMGSLILSIDKPLFLFYGPRNFYKVEIS